MPWQDRIQQARYTSPQGNEFTFLYENVGLSVTKKTTQFDFPGGNGSFIQDLGHTGKRYKLQLIFSGADHDTEANNFLNALLETGVGKLEHPLYDTINVVPFGEISRRDDLKSAANQTVFDVTFFETTGVVFPNSQTDIKSEINTAKASFNDAAADKLENELKIENENERISFKNRVQAALNAVKNVFDKITEAQKAVNDLLNNIFNSINGAIDLLIAQPATLAFQISALLQTPGLMAESIEARIDGYTSLIDTLISGPPQTPGNDNTGNNNFQAADLYASGALVALIDNVANTQFETKAQALLVAESILTNFDNISDWREINYTSLGIIDTGEQYEAMQFLTALAAGFLVQISFSLDQERCVILDRNRTIIDLVAELYGTVDDKLDFFIETNDLSGDEIIEIGKGRKVVYFV